MRFSMRAWLGFSVIAAIVAFVTLSASYGRVHTLEYALNWDTLTQRVSEIPVQPGLVFLGSPFHQLIIYPGTVQNIVFSTADTPHDELNARTSDGLQVVLEVTFQYQLIEGEIYNLYMDFGAESYEDIYFDVASHLISEAAAKYSANQFFNSKEVIASALQVKLDEYFGAHLHAHVMSVQIQSCRLPDAFNQAIMDTMTQQQNITNAAKYLDQQTVSLETNLMVAEKQANATLLQAHGAAQQILLQAEAASAMALQNGAAEAAAYSGVKARLGFDNAALLRYVWWDAVGGLGAPGAPGAQGGAMASAAVLVGVAPSALLAIPQPEAAAGGPGGF